MLGKGAKRRRRGDLKKCNVMALIGVFATGQIMRQLLLANLLTGEGDALVKRHQMRRAISVHAMACRL